MFNNDHKLATVSAVLPSRAASQVVEQVTHGQDTHALIWQARGTLLHDHWLKRWLPPISPAKKMLQMVVPNSQVDELVNLVVDVGKLNYQATGAVFSTPHDHAYLGSEFHVWPGEELAQPSNHRLSNSLVALYCIVPHNMSDKVSKAAINAGAHGPVVYYCEGRGLRDRLGWLRITKEHEKEVLMVICEEAEVEDIFDAMAKAGELHLPGRGFMFRLNVDKGMFNLPSRVAHHHYDASMQQMITAIDHLQGHTHWRDQSVFSIGGHGKASGIVTRQPDNELQDQTCLTAIVKRSDMQQLVDMLLDQGAPGLSFNFARFTEEQHDEHSLKINDEYALVRSITTSELAARICQLIERDAEGVGLRDFCLLSNDVQRVATYIPGRIDYRNQQDVA
ncbi:MAG: P-II family nitrogen regulator [Pseudomonadales bacterium]